MGEKIILVYFAIAFLIVGIGLGAAVPLKNTTFNGTMQIPTNPLAPSPPISCFAICAMSGKTCCNGACVNTQKDPKNCGKCGNDCGLLNWCINGKCVKPNIYTAKWKRCLGGSSDDEAFSIQPTSDGGYIMAGDTYSDDGDVSGHHLGYDAWVVKLDSCGNKQWQRSLGGSNEDVAEFVQQTSDGGYIMAGHVWSTDGDVVGNHGECDAWVVKLDPHGNIQWQKCLGGSDYDASDSIQQTSDGGFIVAGQTLSNDGVATGNHGEYDAWIVKLDPDGNIQWQKCLGGSRSDIARFIRQTVDGGYIMAGITGSDDGDVIGQHGHFGALDAWVVKLNSIGEIQWQRCLGGDNDDYALGIQQTSDGGYIMAGSTGSNDGDVAGHHGGLDIGAFDGWVVKLSPIGEIQWQRCLGGSNDDYAGSIQQTSDGGYVMAGMTNSYDGDVSGMGNRGAGDAWIVRLRSNGNILWQRTLGGSDNDYAMSVLERRDGGFIFAGSTKSKDGDVSGNHGDLDDAWVVTLDSNGNN